MFIFRVHYDQTLDWSDQSWLFTDHMLNQFLKTEIFFVERWEVGGGGLGVNIWQLRARWLVDSFKHAQSYSAKKRSLKCRIFPANWFDLLFQKLM